MLLKKKKQNNYSVLLLVMIMSINQSDMLAMEENKHSHEKISSRTVESMAYEILLAYLLVKKRNSM